MHCSNTNGQICISGSGNIIHLPSVLRRETQHAYMSSTRYLNTTGLCLEFYYVLPSSGFISVYQMGEDWTNHTRFLVNEPVMYWKRAFVKLLDGGRGFLLVINVTMEANKKQSAALDDITLWNCSDFGRCLNIL